MKNLIFGASSLLRQAYFQFWFSMALVGLIFLPNWILIKVTFILSCWAITISAQSFIAGAQANKKLVTMDQAIVDKMAEDDRIPTESP